MRICTGRFANGLLMDDCAISRLAAAFYERTLPKELWTHHAHLRVGLWTLLRFPPSESLVRLRNGIRLYNEACGGVNSDTAGYHESITRFYVWRIDRFLGDADRTRPAADLAEELIRLHGDKNLPFEFWTKERLMSKEARLDWVEPDLRPLE
jgi:hypothetical protein